MKHDDRSDQVLRAQFRFMLGDMAEEVLADAVSVQGEKPHLDYVFMLCIEKLNNRVKALEKLLEQARANQIDEDDEYN